MSEPLVSFRETIVRWQDSAEDIKLSPPWSDMSGINRVKKGHVRFTVDSKNIGLSMHCFPLSVAAANILEQDISGVNCLDELLSDQFYKSRAETNEETLEKYLSGHKNVEKMWSSFLEKVHQDHCISWEDIGGNCAQGRAGAKDLSKALVNNLIAIGPRHCPTNLLVFSTDCSVEIWDKALLPFYVEKDSESQPVEPVGQKIGELTRALERGLFSKLWQRLHSAIVAGFQEALSTGPLMHETVHGVVFVVDKVEVLQAITDQVFSASECAACYTSLAETSLETSSRAAIPSGQLISEVKQHVQLCLLSCPMRIVEPIFQCDLQCDQSQLGNLYAVLSRRRGAVFKEDIIEGTNLFLLSAHLPVAQSFQFAQELLKKTSGSGTAPQLSFSHWQLLDQDPFWRPRTEDELEEFGEQYLDEHNLAKTWINKIRKRKGLAVDEQVVVSAEKQRTLNKKK